MSGSSAADLSREVPRQPRTRGIVRVLMSDIYRPIKWMVLHSPLMFIDVIMLISVFGGIVWYVPGPYSTSIRTSTYVIYNAWLKSIVDRAKEPL